MHYVTHRSYGMQNHKFGVTCPGALFFWKPHQAHSSIKKCIAVSRPGHTRMHYVTHRFHKMQTHKFSITYPGTFFVESLPVPPEHKK
jgi:hypothetical protein